MAQVAIYRSPDWHGFTAGRGLWPGTDPLVLIVPEDEDRRRIAAVFAGVPIRAVFTIPELIERYAKSLGKKGLVSIHGLESLLSSILSAGEVPYFNIEKYKQGYARALADFIHHFRKTVLLDLPSAIRDQKGENGFTRKEKDLVRIHEEYENRLADLGHDFRSGLLDFVRRTDAANIASQLGLDGRARIVFTGFQHLNPLESEFIFTVLTHAGEAAFLVGEDPQASEQAVRVRRSVAALLERVTGFAVEHRLPAPRREDFFTALSNAVFSPQRLHHQPERGQVFRVIKENTRFAETVAIARRIRELAENGVAWGDIRIVAPEYDRYAALLQEVFPGYAVPFHLEGGVPLLRYPLAAVIHQLVSQSILPNPYAAREKIFSSPYIRFTAEIGPADLAAYQQSTGVELVPAERLEALLKRNERRTLDFSYIKNVRERAYRTVRFPRETAQNEVIRRSIAESEDLSAGEKERALFRSLVQLYLLAQAERALSVWPSRMSGAAFGGKLLELLSRFDVEESIAAVRSREIEARDRSILEIIKTLGAEVAAVSAPMSKTADEAFPLVKLIRLFSRLLGEAVFPGELANGAFQPTATGGEPPTPPAVSVQPVTGGQYRRWDYTFICGLVDGEFPAREEYNFLHPRKEGLGLGSVYTSVDHARHRFHQLIRSTARGLFLSLPLSDNGRRLPPSPFVADIESRLPPVLQEATDGGGQAWMPMRPRRAREPAAAEDGAGRPGRLYSLREKIAFIAKHVDRNYGLARPYLREIKDTDEALFNTITAVLRFDGLTSNQALLSEYDGMFRPAPLPGASLPQAPSSGPRTLELLAEEIDRMRFTPEVLERYAACPVR